MTSKFQQWKVTQPYLDIRCKLGEGVYYVPERHELRFLVNSPPPSGQDNAHQAQDINNSKLYLIDLHKGPSSLKEIDTGVPIGVTVDIEGVDSSQIVLAGAKDGVTKFNLQTGEHEHVARYWSGPGATEKAARMRSNDGAVDSKGRFWVEAFEDPEFGEPSDAGVVFRLEPDGTLKTMYENIVIPNGITWTASRMHLTDTTIKKIWSFSYEEASGDITDKSVFYEHEGPGNPDGHTMDAEGNLWQALYGGSKVLRISPQGQVTGEIQLPTRNITCCVFAGTQLFITSAKEENPSENPESDKYAGNLFTVDVGIEGAKRHKAILWKSG